MDRKKFNDKHARVPARVFLKHVSKINSYCCVNQIPVSVDGAQEMGTKCFSNPGILCKVVVEGLDGIPILVIQLEAAIELREDRQLSLSSSVVFRIRKSRNLRTSNFQ